LAARELHSKRRLGGENKRVRPEVKKEFNYSGAWRIGPPNYGQSLGMGLRGKKGF